MLLQTGYASTIFYGSGLRIACVSYLRFRFPIIYNKNDINTTKRKRLVSSNSIELKHRLGGEGTSVGEFAHLIRHYLDISAAVGLLGRLV